MMLFVHPVIAQYLDPGAGSYMFQLAIAGLMAFLFFFSSKIKAFYFRFFKRAEKGDAAE